MVKPIHTPDGQTIHLKTTFEVEDRHDVLYTTGKVLITSDEQHMFTTCVEDVKVTELDTGKVIHTLKGDGELLTSISLSPDNTILMTASRSGQIRQWNWRINECTTSFKVCVRVCACLCVCV